MIDRPASGSSEDGNALLRRVGLSVLTSNVDFELQAKREAVNAERNLAEMRQRAALRAAQCRGHLDVLANEARAEEERRMISDRVGRELQAFRKELQDREAKEEKHMRQMYRAMLQPQEPMETFSTEAYGARRIHQIDGSRAYPPIISSAVSLQDASPAVSGVGWRQAPDVEHYTPAPFAPADDYPVYRVEPRTASYGHKIHLNRGPAVLPSEAPDNSEADDLLRVNLARLERLERLGL
jgi:hypothetical protein